MKNIHFILFFIFASSFFFHSCQNSNQNNLKGNNISPTFTEKYTERINQEIEKSKTKKENSILLGFELGMDIEKYTEKFDQLVKQNTLKPLVDFKENSKFASLSADTTAFFYPLEINGEFYPLHFVPVFKEDKLVSISAKISPELGETKTENLYKNLVELYTKKYGNDYLERVNMYKPNDFVWINANRHINLSVSFLSIQIDYGDIMTMDINVKKGDQKKEENKSSSLDDI